MNLTIPGLPKLPPLPEIPLPIRRAAYSEIRRVTTQRSGWLLPAFCAAAGLITALVSAGTGSGPQDDGQIATGTATVGLYLAVLIAAIAAAGSGAQATGAEYRYESLPLTSLFIPDRNVMFGAKLGAAALYSLVIGLAAEIGAGIGLAVLGHSEVQFGLRMTGVLLGGLVTVVCWGVIGASLGLLLRSTSIAVTAMIGWCLIAEPLLWLIVRGIGIPGIAVLFPDSATIGTVAIGSFSHSAFLSPGAVSAVVLILWTGAAGAASWWYLRQREI
jgi:ABC-2 type transport system permease protein